MVIKLENWSVIQMLGSGYDAPEIVKLHFRGLSYGHPRFEDGSPIVTTSIVGFSNGVFKTSSGSEYVLGNVDENYEAVYPNARQRVLDAASKMGG